MNFRVVRLLLVVTLGMLGCDTPSEPSRTEIPDLRGTLYFCEKEIGEPYRLWKLDLASGEVDYVGRGQMPNAQADGEVVCIYDGDLVRWHAGLGGYYLIKSDTLDSYAYNDHMRDPKLSPSEGAVAYTQTEERYVYVYDLTSDLVYAFGDSSNGKFYRDPAWAPDGTLYVAGDPVTNPGIFRASDDLTQLVRIDSLVGAPLQPSVSPDGSQLAFVLDNHIWIMDADGSNAKQKTVSTLFESWPTWSPDGKWLAVNVGNCGTAALSVASNKTVMLALEYLQMAYYCVEADQPISWR